MEKSYRALSGVARNSRYSLAGPAEATRAPGFTWDAAALSRGITWIPSQNKRRCVMTDLYFYFMSNPIFGDPGGALAQEKDIHGDDITLVDSVMDLHAYVMHWVNPPIDGR